MLEQEGVPGASPDTGLMIWNGRYHYVIWNGRIPTGIMTMAPSNHPIHACLLGNSFPFIPSPKFMLSVCQCCPIFPVILVEHKLVIC